MAQRRVISRAVAVLLVGPPLSATPSRFISGAGALSGNVSNKALGIGHLIAIHVIKYATNIKGEVDSANAQIFHERVDLLDADLAHDHIRRRVVTNDDHKGEKVAHGGG